MTTIQNPILPGFNPDPSIVRVGSDYYIATSTFEWYPGVQIHHSRDLANWRLVTRPLTRAAQLDMRGDPDSGGIWAPCLTYADGLFWLIYTDVKRRDGAWKDSHNYLVTAPSIEGPWSDPVYLNSSGFDPSLFHDEDGRKWLLNMIWDHNQTGGDRFGGIVMQEYSPEDRKLVGPVRNIYRGTDLKLTEGPHLYRRDGFYYLLTAEGGTGYDHAVTMARSKDLFGPYETDPAKHVLTARGTDGLLQRCGHADIVETQDGQFYMVHLCSRPLDETRTLPAGNGGIHADDVRRSPLGRETAIQKLVWEKGEFPRMAHGGNAPADTAPCDLPAHPFPEDEPRVTFDGALPPAFQWLRTPDARPAVQPDRASRRPAHLRPRVARFRLRARAAGPSPDGPELWRRDDAGDHARRLSALRRPHRLVWPLQVPLPRRHRERGRPARPDRLQLRRRLAGCPRHLSDHADPAAGWPGAAGLRRRRGRLALPLQDGRGLDRSGDHRSTNPRSRTRRGTGRATTSPAPSSASARMTPRVAGAMRISSTSPISR